jgi:hypothetical protein
MENAFHAFIAAGSKKIGTGTGNLSIDFGRWPPFADLGGAMNHTLNTSQCLRKCCWVKQVATPDGDVQFLKERAVA